MWVNVEDSLPKNRDPVVVWSISEAGLGEYRVISFNPYSGWEGTFKEKVAKWFAFDLISDEEKIRVLDMSKKNFKIR